MRKLQIIDVCDSCGETVGVYAEEDLLDIFCPHPNPITKADVMTIAVVYANCKRDNPCFCQECEAGNNSKTAIF